MSTRRTAHDRDRAFLKRLGSASLTEICAWVVKMRDPSGGLKQWQRIAIERAYKRIAGKELGT